MSHRWYGSTVVTLTESMSCWRTTSDREIFSAATTARCQVCWAAVSRSQGGQTYRRWKRTATFFIS